MPIGVARHNMSRRQAFVPGLDVDAVAWKVAVVAAGGTVSDTRLALDSNMIKTLKATGVWPLLNRFWVFAGENAASAVTDMVTRSAATPVATPTFTTDQGYAGNGTSSYLNLNSTNAGTQNSATFGFYNRSNTGVIPAVEMGASLSTDIQDFGENVSVNYDGNLYFALNDANGDTGRAAPANVAGIYVIARTASASATIYKGGSSFATNSQTSSGVPDRNYCACAAFDRTGTASAFSTRQLGMAFLGNAGFSATNASDFTTAVQTYMTAIGA